jgi:hypothetical protein
MINLSVFELDKIKKICEAVGTEYFILKQESTSGIGSVLTLTYETEIADYPATVSVEVSGVENW